MSFQEPNDIKRGREGPAVCVCSLTLKETEAAGGSELHADLILGVTGAAGHQNTHVYILLQSVNSLSCMSGRVQFTGTLPPHAAVISWCSHQTSPTEGS